MKIEMTKEEQQAAGAAQVLVGMVQVVGTSAKQAAESRAMIAQIQARAKALAPTEALAGRLAGLGELDALLKAIIDWNA